MQKGSDALLMDGQAIMLHVGAAYVPVLRWGPPAVQSGNRDQQAQLFDADLS